MPTSWGPGAGRYVLYGAGWLGSLVATLANLAIVRNAVQEVAARLSGAGLPGRSLDAGWAVEFIDRAMLLILACVGVGAAIWIEHYLRRGLARGDVGIRVLRLLGIHAGVALMGLAVQVLA